MAKAPSESQALREVRRALRWLKRAEKTLAAYERAARRVSQGPTRQERAGMTGEGLSVIDQP